MFKTKLEGLFNIEKIPKVIDKKTGNETEEYVKLGIREAVRFLSVGTGQGFIKCNCNINAYCSTSRCSCKAAKISCSFKCHGKSEQAKCTNNDAFYETEFFFMMEILIRVSIYEKKLNWPKKNLTL